MRFSIIILLLKEIFAEEKFVERVILPTSKSTTIKPYAICLMPGKVIHQKDREVLNDFSKILILRILNTCNIIIHRSLMCNPQTTGTRQEGMMREASRQQDREAYNDVCSYMPSAY